MKNTKKMVEINNNMEETTMDTTKVTITNTSVNEVDTSELEDALSGNAIDTLTVQNNAKLAVRQTIVSEIDKSEFEDFKNETLEIILTHNGLGIMGVKGMPIYLLPDGISGFYARNVELNGGVNMIALNKYETGKSISDDILINNYDIIQIYNSTKKCITKEQSREGKKSYTKIAKLLSLYSFRNVIIDPIVIIMTLIKSFSQLPLDSQETMDINKIYSSVVDYVNETMITKLLERKGFYAFDDYNFGELADRIKISKDQLLEILKKNGLLYLQKSSVGYQSKVKGMGNCYCIRTLTLFQTAEDLERISKEDEDAEKPI